MREVSYCSQGEGPNYPLQDHMGRSGGRGEGEIWVRAFTVVFYGIETDEVG